MDGGPEALEVPIRPRGVGAADDLDVLALSHSCLLEQHADVQGGGGVGKGADRDEVDPGLAHLAHRLERDPPGRLE
jgi:hypothetical protein